MISKTQYLIFVTFLVSLSFWLGAGVYHSIQTTWTWYEDPLRYVNQMMMYPLAGEVNPFPILAVLTTLSTMIALIAFFKYKGGGRKEVRFALYGTIGIILVTAVYFVPTLANILSNPPVYDTAELISSSRAWLLLNLVRLTLTATIFFYGLLGLSKLRNQL
ncbi:MAG: hypothetical protein L0Y80_04760 [Ignavibacteriae bacterium]|nr:hypothetical protein [Ignavibacteriota bacterium]